MTRVVNLRDEPYDIYIGRGSIWGNPFYLGIHGTRTEVIEQYKHFILGRPELLDQLETLRNKTLGCYCKPLACHGDVLVDLVDKSEKV